MAIQSLKLNDLKKEFDFLANLKSKGIFGIWRVNSQKPGPTLGITICTHGNEPSGLAALRYLRRKFDIKKNLERGSLIFVLNNLKAAQKSFRAKTEDEKRRSRFIDINFNRLPANTLKLNNDSRYEIKRARELCPIWREFDFAIDIHSTSQKSDPMTICGAKLDMNLIRGFPIDTIISNIDKIQIGRPAFSFYGRPSGNIPLLEIECGAHTDPMSFKRAIISVLALLKNLRMISGESDDKIKIFKEYFIKSSIMFPDNSYALAKVFKNYEFVQKNAIIASNERHMIRAPFDCHIFMAPPTTKPASISEEVVFLSGPVKNTKIF